MIIIVALDYPAEVNPSVLGYALEFLVGVDLTQHKLVVESVSVPRQLRQVLSVELVAVDGTWPSDFECVIMFTRKRLLLMPFGDFRRWGMESMVLLEQSTHHLREELEHHPWAAFRPGSLR